MGSNVVEATGLEVRENNGFRSLYATEHFHQGQTIVELPTWVKDEPDMYSIQIGDGIHLDCADHPVGATNHGCDPNAAVRHMRLVAWKCIKPGEEILIDYKRTEEKLAVPFDCNCGAKTCRGRIE